MLSGVDLINSWCFAIEAGSFLSWSSRGAVNGSCHDNESRIDARTLIECKYDDANIVLMWLSNKDFKDSGLNGRPHLLYHELFHDD